MQRRGRKGASPHRCFFPSSQDLPQFGVGAVNFLCLPTQPLLIHTRLPCSTPVCMFWSRQTSVVSYVSTSGRRLFLKRCDTAARPTREPSSQVYPYKNFGIPLCQEQIATRVRDREAWKDALTARRGRHKQRRHFADHTQQEGLQYRVRRLVIFVLEGSFRPRIDLRLRGNKSYKACRRRPSSPHTRRNDRRPEHFSSGQTQRSTAHVFLVSPVLALCLQMY